MTGFGAATGTEVAGGAAAAVEVVVDGEDVDGDEVGDGEAPEAAAPEVAVDDVEVLGRVVAYTIPPTTAANTSSTSETIRTFLAPGPI